MATSKKAIRFDDVGAIFSNRCLPEFSRNEAGGQELLSNFHFPEWRRGRWVEVDLCVFSLKEPVYTHWQKVISMHAQWALKVLTHETIFGVDRCRAVNERCVALLRLVCTAPSCLFGRADTFRRRRLSAKEITLIGCSA